MASSHIRNSQNVCPKAMRRGLLSDLSFFNNVSTDYERPKAMRPAEKLEEYWKISSFNGLRASEGDALCANDGTPERITVNWLGHAGSEMVRHYYHLTDEESRQWMDKLNLLGGSDGCSDTDDEQPLNEE